MSVFKEYYSDMPQVDRYAHDPRGAVDVIIPVFHTNELWRANLDSIYREVPVRRLLISDGGCIDDSISIVEDYPRVEVFDHSRFKSLGKCIAELIKQVSSEWFIYLHSDVYLPSGWFDTMAAHQGEYDWFGCPMNITVLVNYRLHEPSRPYAGSQMGRRAAFFPKLNVIEDDYVYRQEDFVFKRIVEDNGFKEGKVEDTFHYHQMMFRPSRGEDINVESVNVVTRRTEEEIRRATVMQLCGIVKYLEPDDAWVIHNFLVNALFALDHGYMTRHEIEAFITLHNARWSPHFNRSLLLRRTLRRRLMSVKEWISSGFSRPNSNRSSAVAPQ